MSQTLDTPTTIDSGFPSPRMPQRVMVRAYRTLEGAERAVELLVEDLRIPRDRITVVARNPRRGDRDLVGTVYFAARVGALLGALCGLSLYLLDITQGESALLPIVAAALAGTIAGAALALGVRVEPDNTLRFSHYDVLVDEEVAADAREALTGHAG